MIQRFGALLFALALVAAGTSAATAAPTASAMQLPPQPKSRPAGMPAGYVMVSPCIPGMGEHWANPKSLSAPIYGTYDGQIVFSEIMITKKQLDSGFNYSDLTALPGHTINHVDMDYMPHGHPGMPFAHYDIHAYYVPHATHLKYCPAK